MKDELENKSNEELKDETFNAEVPDEYKMDTIFEAKEDLEELENEVEPEVEQVPKKEVEAPSDLPEKADERIETLYSDNGVNWSDVQDDSHVMCKTRTVNNITGQASEWNVKPL